MMFESLISQLRDDVDTVEKALNIIEGLRNVFVSAHAVLGALPAQVPEGANDIMKTAHQLAQLLPNTPDKLDWQIYDHCAALTRLYSIYEQFVGELVNEYVTLLPKLYAKYVDLPSSVTTQHRAGIGQILLKMGEKGQYKELEEAVIVRELAAAVGGSSAYTLLADAFFVERQNLRYEILCRLFSTLGFKNAGRFINRHSAVVKFIKEERADNSSAQKELEEFVDYRNEAAHRKVENVLAIEAIGGIGRFLVALGTALAELVEQGVLHRHMEIGHFSRVMAVAEVHYDGHIVIGTPDAGIKIAAGEEVIVFNNHGSHRSTLESLQVDGNAVNDLTFDGATEVGIRLSRPAPWGAELRRLTIPGGGPQETQLQLENAIAVLAETADTDVSDVGEVQAEDEEVEADQANLQ